MNYFEFQSLGAQDASLEKRPNPTASVVEEGQAPPVAAAITDDVEDDGGWDSEDAVGLDNVERVGENRHFRDFQDSCRDKKLMVPGTVAEAS